MSHWTKDTTQSLESFVVQLAIRYLVLSDKRPDFVSIPVDNRVQESLTLLPDALFNHLSLGSPRTLPPPHARNN